MRTENLPALNLKHLDKSQWKTYRFDEIAKNISERVDPNNTDLEVYVGLEHIDSESIHLKRSGTPDDVDGQKLRFYPGDVIFGRRRAYQRKAAVATTHGFCSAHALVLRANPQIIDPQLFPFFMHSDAFMHRAIDISVGSLSPTINWGALKSQKFVIPPLVDQVAIKNLLVELDQLLLCDETVINVTQKYSQKLFEFMVDKSEGNLKKLSEILIPKKTKSAPPHCQERYIGLEHVEPGVHECADYGNSSDAIALCNQIETGDLCYSKLRPYLDKAFIASFSAVGTTELLIYRTKLASEKYVLYHMHSKKFIDFVSSKGFGTKMPRVSNEIIGEYEIKVLDDEKNILDAMSKFEEAKQILGSKTNANKKLLKALINQIF